MAKAIDYFLCFLVGVMLYPFGCLIAAFYLAMKDSLFMGESLGKKLMGFGVVSLVDGKPCSSKQSLIRNAFFVSAFILAACPGWGLFLGGVLFFGSNIFEAYLLLKVDPAHRFGDLTADTTVIGDDQLREDLRKRKMVWMNSDSSLVHKELPQEEK